MESWGFVSTENLFNMRKNLWLKYFTFSFRSIFRLPNYLSNMVAVLSSAFFSKNIYLNIPELWMELTGMLQNHTATWPSRVPGVRVSICILPPMIKISLLYHIRVPVEIFCIPLRSSWKKLFTDGGPKSKITFPSQKFVFVGPPSHVFWVTIEHEGSFHHILYQSIHLKFSHLRFH